MDRCPVSSDSVGSNRAWHEVGDSQHTNLAQNLLKSRFVRYSRILQGVRAIDDDAEGPFSEIEYRVGSGEYSDFVSFVSPSDGTLILRKALDYEALKNFSVKLRAQDRGVPPKFSDTHLFVQVTDADDQNPRFLRDSYWGEIPSPGGGDKVQVKPEPVRATDQDEGIRAVIAYSFTASVGSEHFSIDPQSAAITVRKSFYQSGLDGVTLVVRATQADNPDRYSLATVTLSSRNPSLRASTYEKLESIPSKIKIRAREDTAVGTVLLTLSISKSNQPINYVIKDTSREANFFRINSIGEIIVNRQLDYEANKVHRFQVVAIDGERNTTAEIEIEVIDVNEWEPRFRQPSYDFSLPKIGNASKPIALGKLEAADGDQNDRISINVHGDLAQHFFIDQENRLWMHPDAPNITVMHLLATVTDNGSPSRNSTVPITITNNAIERYESSWAGSVLKAFAFVFVLFLVIIASMCIHIYRRNERQPVDPRRSPSTLTLKSKYVKNDVAIDPPRSFLDMKCANYQTSTSQFVAVQKSDTIGSGSSVSAGASTILAATLEREAQRDRDMENYTATVRSECLLTSISILWSLISRLHLKASFRELRRRVICTTTTSNTTQYRTAAQRSTSGIYRTTTSSQWCPIT